MATDEIQSRTEPSLVFAAYTRTPAGRPQPPAITTTQRPGSYLGYFENENGEKWVFEYDTVQHKGRLYGEDCSWKEYDVNDGKAPALSLDPNERHWLAACWEAATRNRRVTAPLR